MVTQRKQSASKPTKTRTTSKTPKAKRTAKNIEKESALSSSNQFDGRTVIKVRMCPELIVWQKLYKQKSGINIQEIHDLAIHEYCQYLLNTALPKRFWGSTSFDQAKIIHIDTALFKKQVMPLSAKTGLSYGGFAMNALLWFMDTYPRK